MPINLHHQLSVLLDILANHQTDCCGTVAECEQLERLVQSLLANDNLSLEAKNVLIDVYQYSQTGKYTQHLDEHITNHQENLSHWVHDIHHFS
ncbi:YtzH-like family protein [Bacillus salitolerans]|uniref:YtzH-like family protein n=1 Tax=Bacillus salitolerans TaxID=1437434 RepID=A0ABW4LXI1_9BACI